MKSTDIDNRKREIFYVAGLLFFISIAIMILSIVASDNFGVNYKESFELYGDASATENVIFRNGADQVKNEFNDDGYKIVKTCLFDRYFTQGLEFIDHKVMLLSSGKYGMS